MRHLEKKTMRLSAAGILAASLLHISDACAGGGYVNIVFVPGYTLMANPLLNGSDSVRNIFAGPPNYLTIFKRNALGTGYESSTFDPDAGGWTDPNLALKPGEGAFLYNPLPKNYTNTFVGGVQLNSTNTIPAGYSIRASILPQSGGLQTVLAFPVSTNDTLNTTIYRHVPGDAFYKSYTYDVEDLGGVWTSGAPDGPEPAPRVGESFWIYNPNGIKLWVRNFTIN